MTAALLDELASKGSNRTIEHAKEAKRKLNEKGSSTMSADLCEKPKCEATEM